MKRVTRNMKSKPILFSGPMVRAILEGRKSKTRRIMKPQPSELFHPSKCERYYPSITDKNGECAPGREIFGCYDINGEDEGYKCKWEPGDHLWVRETWAPHDAEAIESKDSSMIYYRADDYTKHQSDGPWKPSIFMPRWASRITLEITNIRVERLQEISGADAVAEGIYQFTGGSLAGMQEVNTWDGRNYFYDPETRAEVTEYWGLWESINGPGSWEANPYVWVIEFKRL